MIVDDAFANLVLNALAGAGKAAGLPATMWLALYDGDPSGTGVEVAGGNYGRIGPFDMTSSTLWPNATGRIKTTAVRVNGPVLTGPFTAPALWAAFVDTASGAPSLVAYAQQLPVAYEGVLNQRLSIAAGGIYLPISSVGAF